MTADIEDFKQLLAIVADGRTLTESQAESAFDIMMSGDATPSHRPVHHQAHDLYPFAGFQDQPALSRQPTNQSRVGIADDLHQLRVAAEQSLESCANLVAGRRVSQLCA